MKDKIFTQDEIQDLLEDIQNLIDDLGVDYQQLSPVGKQSYDELCSKLSIEYN